MCFKILNWTIFFLNFVEIPNGNFILPLNTEQRSDINAEDVGPGPAPSPCRADFPTGIPSITIAFDTPSILAKKEFFEINHGWTRSINLFILISEIDNNFIL